MDSVVEAFDHYAEDYEKWFDTPEGKVLFKTEVEAYSSTLCQLPSQIPYEESVHNELIENAGFVCILARKIHSYTTSS